MSVEDVTISINPPPSEALKYYRRFSSKEATEHVQEFLKMPLQDQIELLFYMSIYQSNAVNSIGDHIGITFASVDVPKDN